MYDRRYMIQIVGIRKRSIFRTSFFSASEVCAGWCSVSSIISVPIFSVSPWGAMFNTLLDSPSFWLVAVD